MDKDIITDYGNLYRAYRKAKSGKGFNSSTAKFSALALDGISILKKQLEEKTYCISPYNEFKIYEPKERVIMSCAFKDKVVQHCLCDNILHPRLSNEFIKTNYAGQIGKGTLFGMECLKEQMLEFYRKYKLDGWILKCDVTKFFYQIDHEVLKDIVDYHFQDEYTEWLNHLLIDSTDGPGLPLGNQAAQVYALLMLNSMDHMITGDLGIRYYGRYMDDFYLMHYDKEYLKWCLDDVAKYHVKKYLDSRKDDNEALFVTTRGERKRLKKTGIEYIIRRLGEKSGLGRRVYPHLFRKTTATNMVRKGCPRDLVAFYLGHKNGNTKTLNTHYAATDPTQVIQAFRQYGAAA